MFIVESYGVAVALCFVTMLCWGSWANTQKLASQEWRFQLFYWDYSIGVLLLALLQSKQKNAELCKFYLSPLCSCCR